MTPRCGGYPNRSVAPSWSLEGSEPLEIESRGPPTDNACMKGGTLLERIIAWYGIALLAFAMFFAFSTAFDPRFGFDSPLWVGGFIPLVWLIAAIRQLVAWYEGGRTSVAFDPVRARLDRRALPTLAWIAAPMFTGVLLYAVLRLRGVAKDLDMSEGLIRSGGASLAVLYGTFFLTLFVLLIMPRASDRRDRLATEAAGEKWLRAPEPDEKAARAAKELPPGIRKTTSILQKLGLAGLVTWVIFFVVPWPIPSVLFYVATLPTWVWVAYIYLVVRPRLRQIERDQASRDDLTS
jgi:hypothetical protein